MLPLRQNAKSIVKGEADNMNVQMIEQFICSKYTDQQNARMVFYQ